MKDNWVETDTKKVNKKKIIICIIIAILVIFGTVVGIMYCNNTQVREWIDKNVLRKEVKQDNLATIEIKEGENPNVYAFHQSIGILSKNEFKIYNNMGKEEKKLTIEISNPVFNSSGRYLAMGETKGQKLYLITDKEVAWEKTIEGKIAQICVNKNGYVGVTIVDTINKTVIAMYDPQGNELFYTYLSRTRVADISISDDNKYLAIAEIDTSGTMIVSNIKIVAMDQAKIVQTYTGENNDLVTDIRYQDKNKLVCMYTDKITTITQEGKKETISQNENKKVSFSTIELTNSIATLEEKSAGLFTADSVVTLTNIDTKNQVIYTANAVTKEIYSQNNIIALNLGNQIEFIDTNGWLVKRYLANQEITNITITNSIAGIIYRDKIEIIRL